PLSQVDEYGETVLAQRISMVAGVAQVIVYGSQKYAVRVQLDPTALAYRKIGIDEVADAINKQNVNLPTGVLWGPNKAFTVQANGQLQNAESFGRMVVTYRNGAPVRDVKMTLLLTLVLVVGVIFLFLRNVSATIIPSLALPISVVGTFAVMDLLGYSLDNLSLMALTLAVGFVVDDAIVMLENIV